MVQDEDKVRLCIVKNIKISINHFIQKMDILDFVLEEGDIKISEVLTQRDPSIIGNRPIHLQNGLQTFQFLQQPLPHAQTKNFSHLKRLLPRP